MTAEQFSKVYQPLGGQLYRVAFHILESEMDAEDAVQDLYLRLWNSHQTLDTVENPTAYCLTLIRNICVDKLRQSAIRQSTPVEEIPEQAELSLPSDILEQRESIDRIMQAMRELPPRQRQILNLKVFQDLPYQEIEKRTGIPYLTLRVSLSRAIKKLRMCYEDN